MKDSMFSVHIHNITGITEHYEDRRKGCGVYVKTGDDVMFIEANPNNAKFLRDAADEIDAVVAMGTDRNPDGDAAEATDAEAAEPGTTSDAPSARAAPRYPNITAFCGAYHRGVVAIDWSGEDIQAFAYRDGWYLSDSVCFGAGATVDQALQQIEAYLRTEPAAMA
jgi:hypothetical protein